MVWPRLKVFWLCKGSPTGHSERKQKEEADRRGVWKTVKEWTGMNFASSARVAENRTTWKGIVANSSVVPGRPFKVMG